MPTGICEHTNNDAEIYAIYRALQVAHNLGFFKIEIRTDSQLIIDYFERTRESRYKNATILDIDHRPNDYIILKLESVLYQFKEVIFTKIRGHSTDANNIQADKLAKQAIYKN